MSERRTLGLIAGLMVLMLAIELTAWPGIRPTPLTFLAAAGAFAPLLARRSHPVAAGLVSALLLVGIGLMPAASAPSALLVPGICIVYACGAHAPLRRALPAAASVVLAGGFAAFTADEEGVPYLVSCGCAWLIGRAVGTRRAIVAQLDQRNLELEAEEAAFSRLAVRHERARIARELHDIVAHHIAVMVVQAGAGRLAGPEDAAVRLAAIRESGQQALAEMARLVEVLHVAEGDAAGDRLAATLDRARAGGMALDVELPLFTDLSAPVADAVHRVVQEALTNALKHAPGGRVRVRVRRRGEQVEVDVLNERAAAPSPLAATGSGMGLTGMRDRVEDLGGTFSAGVDDGGGWRVHAVLPLAGAGVPA